LPHPFDFKIFEKSSIFIGMMPANIIMKNSLNFVNVTT
jgi:hypothetical protein